MTVFRLSLRLHRLELTIFAIALLALALFGFGMALLADGGGLARCLPDPTALGCAEGLARAETFSNLRPFYSTALAAVSVLAAMVIGIGVVGQEIEQGTAALAWTLFPSRRRWLWPRILLAVGILIVLVGAAAFAADFFERARHVPPLTGDSVIDYQVRGLPVVGRGLLAFAVALFVGARVGRILPALLLALTVFVPILVVIGFALSSWQMSELEPITDPGAFYVQEGYRDADGNILGSSEAFSILPGDDPEFASRFTAVSMGWPGSRSAEFVARETIVYLLVAGVLGAATVVVVDRRRPS